MTMNEQQGDEISAVASGSGCRPRITTLPLKAEVMAVNISTNGESSSQEQTVADGDEVTKAPALPDPDNLLKTHHPPPASAAPHRSKHMRSFSDCTGLSSTQSNKPQNASYARTDHDAPTSSSSDDPIKSNTRPRFLEDGGSSIIVAAGGQDYPKRQRGQSLVEYLMSNHSGKVGPELDRENAHFSVSEAMIAAIEESRFQEWKGRLEEAEDEQFLNEAVDDESDEEIRQLKLELQAERLHHSSICGKSSASHSVTESSISPASSVSTLTPPLSPSFSSSSVATAVDLSKRVELMPSDSGVSFTSLCSEMEKERRRSRKLARLKRVHSRLVSARSQTNSPSSSDFSPLVSAPIDVCKRQDPTSRRALVFNSSNPSSPTASAGTPLPPLSESAVSAESVALSLLGHFSQLRLPHENDMEWLVSEKDAPQHLLPMPRSWPVNPDEPFTELRENEVEDGQASATPTTTLRGNFEWAPPRPQIVFAVYSSPNLKVTMAKQNYRCAGCGMRVEPEYSYCFRYCHYLGRYFCTACHTNKLSIVPSLIFKKWDFKKFPVSNFSYDLLERMWYDPLFRLGYINPLLYRRCRQLSKVLELRTQLVHVGGFLRACRFATEVWDEILQEAGDWVDDPEIYSLHDLTRVNSGEMFQLLRKIVSRGIHHVIHCELCKARGFLCETCHSSEVIFPFQVDNVIRCDQCGSCYHRPCWTSASCPRCKRIHARRSSQDASTTSQL